MIERDEVNRTTGFGPWLGYAIGLLSLVHPPPTDATGGLEISGAGSSPVVPVMESWGAAFAKERNIQVKYESPGSGKGIQRVAETSVTARSVNFAIVDVPLTMADLERNDLVQYPLVAGAIVPVANVPGVAIGELRLSGPVLALIFLGKISSWNAPELHTLNPGLELPSLPIKVLDRSDASGSTFIFTYYLSNVSPEWEKELGIGSRVNWVYGDGVRGEEEMAREVSRTVGSIGYLDLSRAANPGLLAIRLRNAAGRFVTASEDSVAAAMSGKPFSRPSYYEIVVNGGSDDSWPIVGVSFVLMPRRPSDVGSARRTSEFFQWIYRRGGEIARANRLVPLTDADLIARIDLSLGRIGN